MKRLQILEDRNKVVSEIITKEQMADKKMIKKFSKQQNCIEDDEEVVVV
jgi:protein-arginine kinase